MQSIRWLQGPPTTDIEPRLTYKIGTTLVNEAIRSKFVYLRTSIETAGQLFEWDNFVEAGGGPSEIPHVHPHMREVFQIVDGEIRFVIDGQERVAGAGSSVVVQPGAVHAFQNVAGRPAHMISRFEPGKEGVGGTRTKRPPFGQHLRADRPRGGTGPRQPDPDARARDRDLRRQTRTPAPSGADGTTAREARHGDSGATQRVQMPAGF